MLMALAKSKKINIYLRNEMMLKIGHTHYSRSRSLTIRTSFYNNHRAIAKQVNSNDI